MTARARPATGSRVPTSGAPDALEHSYTRQGSYDISTTTSYDLTFVLPGGGAQTVQLLPAQPARDAPGQRDPDPRQLRCAEARPGVGDCPGDTTLGPRDGRKPDGRGGRRPGAPDTRAEILASARVPLRRPRLRRHVGAGDRRGRRGGPRAGAPLLRHQGRPVRRRAASSRSTRGWCWRRSSRAGSTARGSGCCGSSSRCGTTRTARLPLLGLVRGAGRPGRARLLRDGLFGGGAGPGRDGARARPSRERRVALVASQMIGLVMLRYVLRGRAARLDGPRPARRDVRPHAAALPRRGPPAPLDAAGSAVDNSSYDE